MDSNKPTTSEVPLPQGGGDLYDNTINNRPTSQDQSGNHGSDYDPGVPGTATAASHDILRRAKTAAATEIGDPHGRIPSAEQTRQQLAAAKNSSLPVDASRSAQTHLPSNTALPSTAHEHRESNYAPGYEKAFDAVPQRSYDAVGHEPTDLPHEKLGMGNRD